MPPYGSWYHALLRSHFQSTSNSVCSEAKYWPSIFSKFVRGCKFFLGMKINPTNPERVTVQYKFEDQDIVLVKMMTLNEYENLKKIDNMEFCKLM